MELKGKKVAILIADGFEQSEYEVPKRELERAGATVTTVSIEAGVLHGWHDKNWGNDAIAELGISAADPAAFDALVLPGGVMSPDTLRKDENVVDFVRAIADAGKPIAAICHGPWTLINAGVTAGRKMTSYGSIRMDLENSGAEWSDEAVVVDNGLVTSRTPDDLPQFCQKMIEEIGEGIHSRRGISNQAGHGAHR